MKKRFQLFVLFALFFSITTLAQNSSAPQPILPIPQPKQVEWQKMETYAFIHFGLNTFNDKEWGYGDTSPEKFNPSRLDCEQWVKTLAQAGMKGVIITAKHHDGFCLWPTKYTDYCIRNSPFRDGKGDVLRELSDACRKYGIKCAFYLSPWDRHQAFYGTPLYVEYFHRQLEELLTQYGDVFEVWFDGANGGDGWYGGARDKRTIDRKNYYDYPWISKMVESKQPNAIIFSDGGPGCRWVGNENGFAGATNWSFLRQGVVYPGYPNYHELTNGHADGNQWVPAECDVSIRPGWFYHPEEDGQVKSVDQLTDLYYRSVGHNATLLLNFPVDRDGLIHPVDSANAVNFYKNIQKQFKHNLLMNRRAKASNERGQAFGISALTDGKYDTYWATADGVNSADIVFSWPKLQSVNCVLIQEYIPLGQRVKAFAIEYKGKQGWMPVITNEECTTIGYKRLVRFNAVKTNELRIRFIDARGALCINNVEAYDTGVGQVAPDTAVAKMESLRFSFVAVSHAEAQKAMDRDEKTTLFVEADELVVDLGKEQVVSSLCYLPDQALPGRGLIHSYTVFADDKPVASGEFSNIKHNPILQTVYFTPTKARIIRLKANRMVNDGEHLGFAEIAIK